MQRCLCIFAFHVLNIFVFSAKHVRVLLYSVLLLQVETEEKEQGRLYEEACTGINVLTLSDVCPEL